MSPKRDQMQNNDNQDIKKYTFKLGDSFPDKGGKISVLAPDVIKFADIIENLKKKYKDIQGLSNVTVFVNMK
jgi:hypothetical protein